VKHLVNFPGFDFPLIFMNLPAQFAKDCGLHSPTVQIGVCAYISFYVAQLILTLVPYFFSKFLHVKNWVYQWNIQKISYQYFWLWIPRSLTHTVYAVVLQVLLLLCIDEKNGSHLILFELWHSLNNLNNSYFHVVNVTQLINDLYENFCPHH